MMLVIALCGVVFAFCTVFNLGWSETPPLFVRIVFALGGVLLGILIFKITKGVIKEIQRKVVSW